MDAGTVGSALSITEQYAPPAAKAANKSLGKDEFMALLIAQLKNQDPTAPIENVEMISQMTQFATMESINAMGVSMMQSQAYSMIGKGIVGLIRNAETGETTDVIGTVDGAGIEAGKPYVLVGEQRVNVEDILQVFDKSIIAGNSEGILAATSMVGKYVRANVGTATQPNYIEGKVDRWQTEEDVIYITLNGQNVSIHQVIAVAEDGAALGEPPALPAQPTDTNPPADAEV
ncbi:MAG: hypothetical protein LBR72_04710 [Oscillospiraceae bacterium]|jgi:flagellar basal-body rod modification protein FlgD|nr:hypothetical protein [Oscillospiraceae bacterium]